MYLLDTNVVSEIRKGDRCDEQVASWYRGTDAATLYLSVMVTGEIRRGIERASVRDPRQAEHLSNWLESIEQHYRGRILAVDARIADEWGKMTAIRADHDVDCLLAATAKVHGLTLVTRNVKHVEDLGVQVFNPFEYS